MNSLKDKLAHYAWDIAYGTYTDRIISEGLREVKINIVKNTYKISGLPILLFLMRMRI